jgi:1-hydroxycarotenoid 3,4-desaturase
VSIPRVAVIGAGIAGLTAAVDLARGGLEVLVFDRADAPGGKMRELTVADRRLDAGPTVLTLRDVFDELFAAAGDSLDRHLKLIPARVLARHAWNSHEYLDLHTDSALSAAAIARFAGPREADGFERFIAQARRIHRTLDASFMRAARPSPLGLAQRIGFTRVADLWNIQPFVKLIDELARYFRDERLKQLFARYATYCGSSPFESPATLMLIAYVEQAGVWYVEGGMHRLAACVADLATRLGATLRYGTHVARIHLRAGRVHEVELADGARIRVDAVVSNADNNALASGLLGPEITGSVRPTLLKNRSLSAVTWNLVARTEGFPLARHSVFFSADYRAEFDALFGSRRLPDAPTVYVCAQDRLDGPPADELGAERLLCLVNAPAMGDRQVFQAAEIQRCEDATFRLLEQCGLTVHRAMHDCTIATPTDFERLFPATGGALYGPASHGWMSSFTRPGSRSRVPGLYLAGGSTHPGPGVPMAAISGRLAARQLLADCDSTARSRRAAMPGGTSTRSATTVRKA